MLKKMGFRSVVSLVIGSQIGSGVFLLPASLAILGPISLFGWAISGTGAILLALIFAQLSMKISSKGGGPHVYIEKAFGRKAAFFAAWTYWLVSWVSSIAVIISAIGYLSPILGLSDPLSLFILEASLIVFVTLINIRSTAAAGSLEFILTILKCIPLLIIPIVGLFFLHKEHFAFTANTPHLASSLSTASLLTFWGFVGLETATTASAVIENPSKVIPKAVITGTLIVAFLYFLNSVGIMGVVPPEVLKVSQAPYVNAAEILFGSGWDIAIAIIAFIACLGTLNAWVLTSGQIASEASKDGLFPAFFSKANKSGSPYMSLLIALVCTIALLGFTLTPNILTQLNAIIDISVTTFLFIYLACAAAFIKILFQEGVLKKSYLYIGITTAAAGFCFWVLSNTSLQTLLIGSLFTLSGLPIFLWRQKKQKVQEWG